MDKKTFELLEHLSKIPNPTLEDCKLSTHTDNYKHLLELNYLIHRSGQLNVKVTVLGIDALEQYILQKQLLELQKQNTSIQKSLKNIQWLLLLATTAGIVITIFKTSP